MNSIDYFFSRLLRFSLLFFILYLIFTNFGIFLIIIAIILILGYFFIYKKIKKLKEQANTQGFSFNFNGRDFTQGSNQNFKFNYEDFQNFQNGNFQGASSISDIKKAKDFFGFESDPSKEEIKRRYKELAKKYHPDLNDHGETLMQELNHYKEVLLKAFDK